MQQQPVYPRPHAVLLPQVGLRCVVMRPWDHLKPPNIRRYRAKRDHALDAMKAPPRVRVLVAVQALGARLPGHVARALGSAGPPRPPQVRDSKVSRCYWDGQNYRFPEGTQGDTPLVTQRKPETMSVDPPLVPYNVIRGYRIPSYGGCSLYGACRRRA